VFFFLIFLFFVTPIIAELKKHLKQLMMILLVSLAITGSAFVLLPSQGFAVRTFHVLNVEISEDSGSVVLENFNGPTNGGIPWEEVDYDGTIFADSVTIPPGGQLSYSREMTGGLSFMLSASEKDSTISVEWDGIQSVIKLERGKSIDLEMDPASLGILPRESQLLLFVVKTNEWLCLFLGLTVLFGIIYLKFLDREFKYRTYQRELFAYLVDYLSLAAILLLVAIIFRIIRPDSLTNNLVIVLPSLIYLLLKVIYRFVPTLPIIVIILAVGANFLAHSVWFDKHLLKVTRLTDTTFYKLADTVYPSDATLLSLGFYEQLRDSVLILPPTSFLAEEENVARLIRINFHEHVYVLDYPGELARDDYQRVMDLGGWTKWDRRDSGSFYFYRVELPITTPIVCFTYEDNVLLVPENQLDSLGLFNDFVLD
jgi:hypothetical protein